MNINFKVTAERIGDMEHVLRYKVGNAEIKITTTVYAPMEVAQRIARETEEVFYNSLSKKQVIY